MAHLKSNCSLRNPTLRENLNIEFDIRLEGKVMELWSVSPTGGKIMAQVYWYGDDGNKGDEFRYFFEYPLKLSNTGGAVLEEKAHIPFQMDHSVTRWVRHPLDEDKTGRDEVYAVFFLSMTFETKDGLEVDAVISDLLRTNTLRKYIKL